MSQNTLKESNWYADFNLKPLILPKKWFYSTLSFWGFHPNLKPEYGREDIEQFLFNTKAKINYIYEHKFYATYYPKSIFTLSELDWLHQIYLPHPDLYQGDLNLKRKYYYFTLFHELTHWTGSEKHLNRFQFGRKLRDNRFDYASEEIVATTGCLLLLEKFNLDDVETKERGILYMNDYLSAIVYEMIQNKKIVEQPDWTTGNYLDNDPIVNGYIYSLMMRAKDAVTYLEQLQK